jgi:two-component system LytT family response regulator
MNFNAKTYRALIVDDEELARQDLTDVLSEFDAVTVVAEADSIARAREQIDNLKPDLIFLDIQLPGENGFDLLEHLSPDIKIIFVTAFDRYAIRAFEVNALDYLMKPVSRDRLTLSLNRLKKPAQPDSTPWQKLNPEDSIFLPKNQGYSFVRIRKILCIEARDDYSLVTLPGSEQLLVNKSMREWESRLPEELFCRIHRSTIINLEKVRKIEPWQNHSYLVIMEGIEQPLVMSRRYFSRIKARMG